MALNQSEPAGSEPVEGKPKAHNVWENEPRWKKLQLLKDALGSWNRFADVAVEQLLASGLVSNEVRDQIHAINREHGIYLLDDTAWMSALKIREPWPETASNIRKIKEALAENNRLLADLAQVVKDHATVILEVDAIRNDS